MALSRSLSVSYRRELRAPFALCGSHSARGFVSARAPSSAPCLTTHTPIATTAKEVLNNLVYSTPSTPLSLEIRPGTRPATSGQFQFPGPNWPRVTPGDSPGHFPTPGGRFEDQFGSVQANFGPNSSPAGSNSSPTGFNSSPAGSKSSPAGSKSSPAGSFETRVWSLA